MQSIVSLAKKLSHTSGKLCISHIFALRVSSTPSTGGGERGQLLQPQDDPPPFTDAGVSHFESVAIDQQPEAAAWSFKSSGIAHALARASCATMGSASTLDDGAVGVRMLPPGQSKSFAWAAVQGKGRAVRLADGQPVSGT
jgi:hypothetical protein